MTSIKTLYLITATTYVIVFFKVSLAYQPYNNTDPDYATSVHHLKLLMLAELEILAGLYSSNLVSKNDFGINTDFIRK